MEFLNYLNIFFSFIFAIELFMKMVALDVEDFIKDRFNLFDAFVVLLSFIEILIASDASDGGSSFGALRAFWLFWLFKLFRVGDLRILLETITSTLGSTGNYIVLLCLFMYIESLLAM